MGNAGVRILIAGWSLLLWTSQQALALDPAPSACPLEEIGTAKVVAVRDARTLLLEDGREVRLAGIEVPVPATDAAAAATAKSTLDDLAGGQTLTLKRLGAMAQDRYGRTLVYGFAGGEQQSLQIEMLTAGQARVGARIGNRACAEELLAAEGSARDDKMGLWSQGNLGPQQADDLPALFAHLGHFTIIEGKVLSVRESGPTIYLNFGQRWTRDFSVTISKRIERSFSAAGIDPKQLEGRRVRVRGWMERRTGPTVELTRPEQIELAERN